MRVVLQHSSFPNTIIPSPETKRVPLFISSKSQTREFVALLTLYTEFCVRVQFSEMIAFFHVFTAQFDSVAHVFQIEPA